MPNENGSKLQYMVTVVALIAAMTGIIWQVWDRSAKIESRLTRIELRLDDCTKKLQSHFEQDRQRNLKP